MAVLTRSNIPATGTITGGTDQSGDANINDELNNILGLGDGSGSFDVVHKQGLVANDVAGNFDTQFKGQTDPDTLRVDASTDSVGIGTPTPLAKIHVDAKNDGAASKYAILDSTSATPANGDERSVEYKQQNDGAVSKIYVEDVTKALDVSAGTEKGQKITKVADGAGGVTQVSAIDIDKLALATGLELGKYINFQLVTKTAAFTAADETVILVDATSGPVTITLPPVSGLSGRTYTIVKVDTSSNAVTIDGDGAEVISGETTRTLKSQFNFTEVITDAIAWFIIGGNIYTPSVVDRYIINLTGNGADASFVDTSFRQFAPQGVAPLWDTTLVNSSRKAFLRVDTNNGASLTTYFIRISNITGTVLFEHSITGLGAQGGANYSSVYVDLNAGNITTLDLSAVNLHAVNTNTVTADTRWILEHRQSAAGPDLLIKFAELILVEV